MDSTRSTRPAGRSPAHRWTVAEYMQLDDDLPCEILDGELIMSPSPTRAHQKAVSAIAAMLWHHARQHALGEVYPAPLDVVLAEDTVVQPDVVFVHADRVDALDDGHGFTGAPDLVVEVLSPATGRFDRTRKRARYQEAGVPWLMLVDPATQTVEVFRLSADEYVLDATGGGDDTLVMTLFPALELDLAALWLDGA